MPEKIKILIDQEEIESFEGKTVLQAARENGIKIPALCYHPDLKIKANCRLCLVEIKGERGLVPACRTLVKQGMEISTKSEKINRARKINLELIFAQHVEECDDCNWGMGCRLLGLAREYKIDLKRFLDRKTSRKIYQFGPIIFDQTKCIDCRNCVEVCARQEVHFLEARGQGAGTEIFPSAAKDRDCTYCGQCIVHCPVGAIEAVGEFEGAEKALEKDGKIKIFQFAPAIRTSIGEAFGLPAGLIVTGQLVAGIKALGADKVFDVSVAADFTTIEEAGELINKIKNNAGPCLTSCCPAWVKYLEFNYPHFITHLATTRSPQIIMGGLIKTYWAEKEKIDPKNITVISIMPCTAKKYEIQRKELEINGLKPVDYVMTTRELAYLFKKNKIDLASIESQPADSPWGEPSGAGVIYGASGGVVESALRTAYYKLTGKDLEKLDFEQVRGMQGIKKAEIEIEGVKIKIAVASGLGNAKKILDELEENPKAYDAVEVMACPGGCIGGGGQPMPTSPEIRKQRAEALYQIDLSKKNRLAHENPDVQKVYEEFLNNDKIVHQVCHTSYNAKLKGEIKILKSAKVIKQ
ncbi:MAG: [FeFe] hydrogenase, group A [Candidatus Paceibacterota bacterium]|jgi:iron-only hydrogenase group A